MNTSVICLMLTLAIAIAKRPCCMPNEYQTDMYVGSITTVHRRDYARGEKLEIAANYKQGKVSINHNSKRGRVQVLVDFNGLTYVSMNRSCVLKVKTKSKQTPRCALCKNGKYLGTNYIGADENTLSIDTYYLNLKKSTDLMAQKFKKISIILSVTAVGDDVIVPVREVGRVKRHGIKTQFLISFLNFKTEIKDKHAFDIPSACQESDIFEDDEFLDNRHSPKFGQNFNMDEFVKSLPEESQKALDFLTIA